MDAKAVVDLRGLKAHVAKYFPMNSVSYQVIMAEPDEIPTEEYVAKVIVWDRMIRAELKARP